MSAPAASAFRNAYIVFDGNSSRRMGADASRAL